LGLIYKIQCFAKISLFLYYVVDPTIIILIRIMTHDLYLRNTLEVTFRIIVFLEYFFTFFLSVFV